jgi:hypothetical protein
LTFFEVKQQYNTNKNNSIPVNLRENKKKQEQPLLFLSKKNLNTKLNEEITFFSFRKILSYVCVLFFL